MTSVRPARGENDITGSRDAPAQKGYHHIFPDNWLEFQYTTSPTSRQRELGII